MTDIAVTPLGDIKIGEDGDIDVADRRMAILNTSIFRLQTSLDDFFPDIRGPWADLQSFIGEPSNAAVGERIQFVVTDSILEGGFISPRNLTVDVVPIDMNTIAILVTIVNEWPPSVGPDLDFSILFQFIDGDISFLIKE